MTLEEAKEKCKILEQLNLDIWNAVRSSTKAELRSMFRDCWQNIASNGYKIRRYKEFDSNLGYKVPRFKVCEDHTKDIVDIVDNRGEGNHHGDCTTRCISFCTGVDYTTIQKEQMANARAYNSYGVTWRTEKIWSKSLTSRGFYKIALPKKMTGKVFLRKMTSHSIDGMIAAKSAHHIAAIDMNNRKILDTWNSAGCRIQTIYVPENKKYEWMNIINKVFK